MFFKRRQKVEEVRPGDIFQRVCAESLVEIAEVTWVGTGSWGVPHVRYQTSYRRPDRVEPQGDRILALDCFAERFRLAAQGARA